MFIEFDGAKFLVELAEAPACITVHPLVLEDSDTRAITVVESVDTATKETEHSIIAPEMHDGEDDIWMSCVQVAALVMANIDDLKDIGIIK